MPKGLTAEAFQAAKTAGTEALTVKRKISTARILPNAGGLQGFLNKLLTKNGFFTRKAKIHCGEKPNNANT